MSAEMNAKMTPKQGIFIAEYLIDGNATRAAIAAGFAAGSADVTGARLLKNSKVAKAITLAHAKRVGKLEVKAEEVLDELKKLAFSDPGKLFDENGKLKPLSEIDERTRAALIVEVEAEQYANGTHGAVSMKVKLADKGQNLERLGRYLKLFTDRVEHDGRVTLEQLVCGADDAEDDGEGGGSAAA